LTTGSITAYESNMLNLSLAYNVSRVFNVNVLVCSTIGRRALCFNDECEGLLFLVIDGTN
jgi:hypothetical protein